MHYKNKSDARYQMPDTGINSKWKYFSYIICFLLITGCGSSEKRLKEKFAPLWEKYQQENYQEAINGFLALEKKYSKTPFIAKVKITRGNAYQKLNNPDEAEKIYQEVIKNFPQSEFIHEAWYGLGEVYKKQHKWNDATNLFSRIIFTFPGTSQAKLAQKSLDEINFYLFMHPESKKENLYTIQHGENLRTIAFRNNLTPEFLANVNGLRTYVSRGQEIIIPKIKLNIKVDLSDRSLILFNYGKRVKEYSVAIGADETKTPIGKFTINQKLVKPTWYFEGRVYQPDDPENRLGSRWIGISAKGYGIHGTNDESVIGQAMTNGCIRMHNADVEELYDIVPEGTEVEIGE